MREPCRDQVAVAAGSEKNFTLMQLIFEAEAAGLWEFENIKFCKKNLLTWLNTSFMILVEFNSYEFWKLL